MSATTFTESQKDIEKEIAVRLTELAGKHFTEEKDFVKYDGQSVMIPQHMEIEDVAKMAAARAAADRETQEFVHDFKFRPWDGAHATQLAMQRLWGISGRGMTTYSFFGSNPPERKTIEVGVDQKAEVPWGYVEVPFLKGNMVLGEYVDPQWGLLFRLTVYAPLKKRDQVEGFFRFVEMTLKSDSIYKGKAIMGTDHPKYIDPFKVKRSEVVYSDEVYANLTDNVWGPIQRASHMRARGKKLNMKSILVGDFGTGKSLAGAITGQVANEHDWTFIQTRTGEDDLEQVMRTAILYQPCVVFVEDVDVAVTSKGDDSSISKVLEIFDGIDAKKNEVMIVMTSNHPDRIPKAMTRAGRIDNMVFFEGLDRQGAERLIKVTVPSHLLDPGIDYDKIYGAMEGFAPSFVSETYERAERAAIVRTDSTEYQLTTEDFVRAAHQLRALHDHHQRTQDRKHVPALEQSMTSVIDKSIQQHAVGPNRQLVKVQQD